MEDIFFIGTNGTVVALELKSGKELWRTYLRSSEIVSVYHENEKVYAGANGHFYILCAKTGKILAENTMKGQGYGIISFAIPNSEKNENDQQMTYSFKLEDLIFTAMNGYVTAFNKFNAEEIWRTCVNASHSYPMSIIFRKGCLIVGRTGYVFNLDPFTGNILWCNDLKGLWYYYISISNNNNIPVINNDESDDSDD